MAFSLFFTSLLFADSLGFTMFNSPSITSGYILFIVAGIISLRFIWDLGDFWLIFFYPDVISEENFYLLDFYEVIYAWS